MTKLAHWFRKVEEADFKSFSILRKTIMNHYKEILAFLIKEALMLPQNLSMLKLKTSECNSEE